VSSTTLPVQVTSFIGRTDEVADLVRRLAEARLLTITGPGGAGKTRLAVEAARRFRAGDTLFVDLSPILDASLVPSAIATTAGIPEIPGKSPLESLTNALTSEPTPLVLDNCEHLIVVCAAVVETLLRTCPSLTLLATSREPLNVPGEVVRRVPALPPGEAAALFVERATAAEPSFGVGPDKVGTIESLCEQLDGLPLAIELAAVCVRVLTVPEIAARLGERLDLLTSRGTTVTGRHQTLRALVDWSYERLSEPEQKLYRRLSVFAGGCSLDAIARICQDGECPREASRSPAEPISLSHTGEGRSEGDAQGPAQVPAEPISLSLAGEGRGEGDSQASAHSPAALLPLLRGLVEKSLVLAEEQGRETRYRMLETLRQHSREKLRDAGEERLLRRRHLDWFRHLAEQGQAATRSGSDLPGWQRRMEREIENCRVALAWSRVAPEQRATALRLATALRGFWRISGHAKEALDWLTSLLDGAPPDAWRARALEAAGWLAFQRGAPDPEPFLNEALSLARAADERWVVAAALRDFAQLRRARGDPGGALAAADEALAQPQTPEVSRLRPNLLTCLALALDSLGRQQHAVAPLRAALRLAREQQNAYLGAVALRVLGMVLIDLGELGEARACLQASLSSETRLPERVQTLAHFGGLLAVERDVLRAVRLAGAVAAFTGAWPDYLGGVPQQRFEQRLEAASRDLDPALRQAAWAEGAAMSLDETIDYALRRGSGVADTAERRGGLTPRELEVVRLLATGLTNRQIAAALVISQRTADRHVDHILSKLCLSNRARAAVWAVEHGLVQPSER